MADLFSGFGIPRFGTKVTITAEDSRLKNFMMYEVIIGQEAVFNDVEVSTQRDHCLLNSWPPIRGENMMQQLNSEARHLWSSRCAVESKGPWTRGRRNSKKSYGAGDGHTFGSFEKSPSSVGLFTNGLDMIQGRVSVCRYLYLIGCIG